MNDFDLTDEQLEALETLKTDNPKANLYVMQIDAAPLGMVVFDKPSKHNRDKYSVCKKQLNEGNQVEVLELLAKTFVVWPSGREQKDLFDEYPALAMKIGGQIQTLASGAMADQAKKV